MTAWLPPLNYDLSPYTGWTRAHWEAVLARLTYGYVLAAERQGSPARALFPDDRCDRPDAVDALEAFARLGASWGAWLRNPANPAGLTFQGREVNLEGLLRQALLDGLDPTNPYTYWGDIGHMDQRLVEAAGVAVTVWLSRERVFDRMTGAERARVIGWLAQVDGKETWPDNWILFPAMAQVTRLKLGYPAPEADLDSRLEKMAAFYRGDGWYADGAGDEFDLYNAWMFGWHYLLWAWMDGDRRPEHRELVLKRARAFLDGFQYFFGANGSHVAWGRSLLGRFATTVAFQIGHWLKIAPPRPGLLRRISSGCLRYFVEHGFFDPEGHFARQGFHGAFPLAGESYVAPGSPLSACHALFALTFDRDDPFWTEPESPLPVEHEDFDLAFPMPGLVVSGRRATGQVILLNGRSGHPADVPRPGYTPKYGKLAYTTHFPFNVAPIAESYAPDAMIALTHDGLTFGHRDTTRAGGAAPGVIWCEYDENVAGQPQRICTAVLVWRDLQLRLAAVRPSLPVRAFEAPGALGCEGAAKVTRRSEPAAGWEYAEAEGRALGIRRLLGYDGQQPSAPFLGYSNLNLAYAYSEQPLVCESQSSARPRALAAVSLLRPVPFDPAREFAQVTVTALSTDSFRITLPDGEEAFVALGDAPPQSASLGKLSFEGDGLRCVRVSRDASRISGLGLKEVAGIASLSAPGTLQLMREAGNVVHVTTDVGFSLAAEWLGGPARRIEALALGGEWTDVTDDCRGAVIPPEVVRLWSRQNERSLVTFRLSR